MYPPTGYKYVGYKCVGLETILAVVGLSKCKCDLCGKHSWLSANSIQFYGFILTGCIQKQRKVPSRKKKANLRLCTAECFRYQLGDGLSIRVRGTEIWVRRH